jgi:hypothetical protein
MGSIWIACRAGACCALLICAAVFTASEASAANEAKEPKLKLLAARTLLFGPFAPAGPLKVQECKANAPCVMEVQVSLAAKGRCKVSLVNDIVIVNFGTTTTPLKLEWQIAGETDRRFRFEPDAGIDIAGDDNQDDFDQPMAAAPPASAASASFAVHHKKRSKFTAFNYTINVQRHRGGNVWTYCGSLDPIIVNRE